MTPPCHQAYYILWLLELVYVWGLLWNEPLNYHGLAELHKSN